MCSNMETSVPETKDTKISIASSLGGVNLRTKCQKQVKY